MTEKFGWSSESCAGHDLQLCIKAGLEVSEIQQVVTTSSIFAEHFEPTTTTTLQKRQQQMYNQDGNSKLQIIQDVK